MKRGKETIEDAVRKLIRLDIEREKKLDDYTASLKAVKAQTQRVVRLFPGLRRQAIMQIVNAYRRVVTGSPKRRSMRNAKRATCKKPGCTRPLGHEGAHNGKAHHSKAARGKAKPNSGKRAKAKKPARVEKTPAPTAPMA